MDLFFAVMMTSFLIVLLAAPYMIPALRRMKFGQEVRTDGPETHLKKQGTPTMGGVIFLPAIVISSFAGALMTGETNDIAGIMILTVGFGLTGLADDWLKIKKHKSEGLKPKQKLILQLAVTCLFIFWLWQRGDAQIPGNRVYIPFTGQKLSFDVPLPVFVPFIIFTVLGTDNGVNFTDGLDGLCSLVTAAVSVFFIAAGCVVSKGVSVVSASVLGALLGFLLFNAYPAKVFMGDTGSLALGGFVAGAACVTGTQLYIPVVGFIYLAEVLSVIIQVTYFRKTGGRRFFRMAPIHHHFELAGNSETRVAAAFGVITVILCLLGITGFVR